jgi:hypothetical protein
VAVASLVSVPSHVRAIVAKDSHTASHASAATPHESSATAAVSIAANVPNALEDATRVLQPGHQI